MIQIPPPLERLIATSQVPLTLAMPEGRDFPLVAANPAFERLTGYDRSELVGRDCRLLQGARTQPSARAVLRQALQEQQEGQAVITNYRRDGTEFGNYVFLFPIALEGDRSLVLASQCEILLEDRTRAFERHGRFLEDALSELETALSGEAVVEHASLSRHDRRLLIHHRLRNWMTG